MTVPIRGSSNQSILSHSFLFVERSNWKTDRDTTERIRDVQREMGLNENAGSVRRNTKYGKANAMEEQDGETKREGS